MKDFKELTNQEVYDLTSEQIEFYKKLVLAENGVKFPIEPIKPELEEEKGDITVYTLDGLSEKWNGLCFESMDDAISFADFVRNAKGIGFKSNNSNIDYSTFFFEHGLPKDWQGKDLTLMVCAETIFSKEKFDEVANSVKAYKKAMEKYKSDRDTYNKTCERAKVLTSFIDERVFEVREDINNKKKLTYLFVNEYLPLAEGNDEIAIKFLEKAYSVSDDDKKYILEHKDDNTIRS